jgi:hypothetical protein
MGVTNLNTENVTQDKYYAVGGKWFPTGLVAASYRGGAPMRPSLSSHDTICKYVYDHVVLSRQQKGGDEALRGPPESGNSTYKYGVPCIFHAYRVPRLEGGGGGLHTPGRQKPGFTLS